MEHRDERDGRTSSPTKGVETTVTSFAGWENEMEINQRRLPTADLHVIAAMNFVHLYHAVAYCVLHDNFELNNLIQDGKTME